ncbi:MAG: MotA/TolQ/ExbB proton channel family protein [Candidatus Krumholzibacteriota bacterium]|nr:MotA/TolQ/ExbB proton channel family protein [Candidatus Krumholzibacteriota bacterium]
MFTEFNWLDSITDSPIFLVLVACSVVTLGVVMERAIYYHKRRGAFDRILDFSLKKIRSGQPQEALSACENAAHPMGIVSLQVLEGEQPDSEPVEERLQISLSEQKMLLERNLGVLGTMAAIAPLIGLLGTIWGIMRAFQDMAQTGSAAPSVVAAGVAEALLTTAAGIVIAVPAILFYNHFTRKMNNMLTVAENCARSLRAALIETGSGA